MENDFPSDFELYESQELNSSEPLDRLSELPDSVVHFIFSFLPMDYVVRTTILSKRWKDLWTFVPYIYFQPKEGELDKFTNFVNRTLMLWKGKKIQKFTIDFKDVYEPSSCTDLNLWVRFALEHEVEELDLDYFFVTLDDRYWMTQRLFSGSSIKKLRIMDCNMEVSGKIHWDQLKSLTINTVRWGQDEIDKVLSGSPQLEILIMYTSEKMSIHSGSLKKLFIHFDLHNHFGEEIDSALEIWTPNLQVLEISGRLYCKFFLQVNVPSLVEATLHFSTPGYDDLEMVMVRDFFQSIHHVEKLSLGSHFIKELSAMEKNDLPSPPLNLKRLSVDTYIGKDVLAGILNLLEISPDLSILEIMDLRSYEDGSEFFCRNVGGNFKSQLELRDSFNMRLKTVTITWYVDSTSLFSFIEFVLKNASKLEKMVIQAKPIDSHPPDLFFEIAQKLLRMPRSSPNAEVVLRRLYSEDDSSSIDYS
ncbi:putative F-box protein At1g49610 isoform X1 [Olea europaea var. sylvestris]|uniref:putative F-box protein At1g49610 isoform X1 n=1 Tax=Olea europaea var. sylvestris TaxID=158386 RepID=UPI000C1CE0E0|nr:putative F-box protein At1g49610 isoform X1 [Olea europaea var. sylvestris]